MTKLMITMIDGYFGFNLNIERANVYVWFPVNAACTRICGWGKRKSDF